ncbi:hypothetical protein VTL71DRAFT_16283 [Oculimacula yallundae]|uniref:Transcription factor domain-containing protein n=1 Tax=Oculimacula yallundae TaxID=86028 RepID=A0ABR4CEL5_9HELO
MYASDIQQSFPEIDISSTARRSFSPAKQTSENHARLAAVRNSTTKPKTSVLPTNATIDNHDSPAGSTFSQIRHEIPEATLVENVDIPFNFDNSLIWNSDASLIDYSVPQDTIHDGSSIILSSSPLNNEVGITIFDPGLSSGNFEFSLQPDIVNNLLTDTLQPVCMWEGPYLIYRHVKGHHIPCSRMSALARRQSPLTATIRPGSSALGLNFILQNMKAYPALLVDGSESPPFIHTTSMVLGVVRRTGRDIIPGTDHLPICKHIVQMWQTRSPQTQAFISRTIIAEMQRFTEQKYTVASDWELLSMLQAMTVFIILRISDPDSGTIDFDNSLVETMTLIAIRLERSGFLCDGEVHGYRPTWEEWILMESKRRTVIILFLICLLFEISPNQGGKAMAGLMPLPLPATKLLWQAKTENEWTMLYDDMLLQRQGRGYLSYADLMILGRDTGGVNEKLGDLNRWYTNLDPLGILVMMAATTF